jgi:hypothetical protein
VADALTLGRLFEALLASGCWVAFTVRCGRDGRWVDGGVWGVFQRLAC